MGIDNPVHLIFLGAIALIVLGPKRLPELARALGKGIREFREAVSEGSMHDSHEAQSQTGVLPPSQVHFEEPAQAAQQIPVTGMQAAQQVPVTGSPSSASGGVSLEYANGEPGEQAQG